MTDETVVDFGKAKATVEKRERKKKAAPSPSTKASGDGPPPPSGPHFGPPDTLPDDAPVKALGYLGNRYFFLDSSGQLRELAEDKLGRLAIISLFGGWDYLIKTWPAFDKDGNRKNEFQHAFLAPVLIKSCKQRDIWDPAQNVRGLGGWVEADGTFVFHCGEYLWAGDERVRAGLRGNTLYPRKPSTPEPVFPLIEGAKPGDKTLGKLEDWNWKREDIDPKLILGWIVAAMMGQATPWRPMCWVTGGRGTGKSTLLRLLEWVIDKRAGFWLSDTTPAAIYQRVNDSSLPVILDEFEAKPEGTRQQDVIALARIAASGGEVGRGGSEGSGKTFTLHNCFLFSSIIIPSLLAQDLSRMAICELQPLDDVEENDDLESVVKAKVDDDDNDMFLGKRDKWARIGRELRGRILAHWPRYQRTFRAYRHALALRGHDSRASDQFGALGAAYDIAMFDELDIKNAIDWSELVQPSRLAETVTQAPEPVACLQFLLGATPDAVRNGTQETIAFYLRRAKDDIERQLLPNETDGAARILEKIGIRVMRDRRAPELWWVCVSNTHPALAKIFAGTRWKAQAGSPGAWAQALRGLPFAKREPAQMRFDGQLQWRTQLAWEAVFAPHGDADAFERENFDERDQAQEAKAKKA